MPDRLHPADLVGRRVFWLLELTWAGMTIRLANAELEVLTGAGASVPFAGVLDVVAVDESIDFLVDAAASPTSVGIEAVLPVDVPLLVAQGHDLASARGELSRWVEGTIYEKRRKVIAGQVIDPEHGDADDPVVFTLELTPWSDTREVPAPWLSVTGENWDDAMILSLPAATLGRLYPIVIGRPGNVASSIYSSGRITGSEGVYVDQRRAGSSNLHNMTIVVAGHHVTAESVYINNNSHPSMLPFAVKNGHDRAGHPIAYIPWWATKSPGSTDEFDYDATASYTWRDPATSPPGSLGHNAVPTSFQPAHNDDPNAPFVAWVDDDDASRGGLSVDGATTMRAAGDVLEWLLSQSGVPVDRGRFAAAKPLLRDFLLDFTIDAGVSPWEFARANLLPLLPVSIVSGPDGVYPIVWRFDAIASDAVAHIDTTRDPRVERASAVSYDRSELANEFELTFALSVRVGNHLGRLRYGAEDTDGATPNLYCTLSQRRYRRPDGSALVAVRSVEALCVYETSTAHAILQWMSRAYAFARRRVDYLVPEADYGHLERGQVVTLTDPALHLERRLAIVEDIRTDGGPTLLFRCLLVEEPVRDVRPTS